MVEAASAVFESSSVMPPVSVMESMDGWSFVPVMVIVMDCWSKPPLSSVTRTVKVSVTSSHRRGFEQRRRCLRCRSRGCRSTVRSFHREQ